MTGTGIPWIDARAAALDEAIRFLKSRCILVQQVSRDMQVAQFRVSGRWDKYLAEDVIDLAARLKAKEARKALKLSRLPVEESGSAGMAQADGVAGDRPVLAGGREPQTVTAIRTEFAA